jgi:hypothetical protein
MQASAGGCVSTYFTTPKRQFVTSIVRHDHRQVQASYNSYACALIVQLHVHLKSDDLGWWPSRGTITEFACRN